MKERPEPAFPDKREEASFRLLLLLWLTTVLFLIGVGLIAAIVLKSVAISVHGEDFFAQFCLLKEAFFADQSAKNATYIAVCLATPFLLGGSYFLARWGVEKIPSTRLMLAFRCANLTNGLFLLGCLFPMIYCPFPAMLAQLPNWLSYNWFFANGPFFTLPRLLFVAVAGWLCWFFYGRPASGKNRNLAFLAVLASAFLVMGSRFYVPVEINDDWQFTHHLNPIIFGISQVMGGHHYLVQFPHRYGGYIEFLAPFLAWFPRRVETILVVLGGLNILAIMCLLVSIGLLIRSPLQVLLAGWSLLGILTISLEDNYYQGAVVRELFPAVGLLLALVYLRSPSLILYGSTSLVAAVAPLWNQDAGMVLWGSWTATLIVRELSERSFRRILGHLAMQGLLLVLAGAAFVVYLRVSSGQWPDFGLLFTFQKVFIGWGYFCLRMLVPDAWMLVVAVYAVGLAASLVFYLLRTFSWRTHALFMMSLMGIGFFSYFMGRSAESNLVNVAFLIPVILGLFLSETRGLIAGRRLPQLGWVLLLPITFMQAWWALLFVLALPYLTMQSAGKFTQARQDLATTAFGKNVTFIQSQTTPGERLYLLSDQAGFYYYLSSTVSAVDLPSTDEFMWTKDIDRLVSAIDTQQIPKLLVDQNFFETKIYRDEVYDRINQAIAQHYRSEAVSPRGRVTLYVPR